MGCFKSKPIGKKIDLFDVRSCETPYFSLEGGVVEARVLDVHDGDTITLMFEHQGKVFKFRCICAGYRAASLHPRRNVPNRDEIIAEANEARIRLMELLRYGKKELVTAYLGPFDTFGRIFVILYTAGAKKEDGSKSVNQQMIDGGFVEEVSESEGECH